jgi:hypothetical protein
MPGTFEKLPLTLGVFYVLWRSTFDTFGYSLRTWRRIISLICNVTHFLKNVCTRKIFFAILQSALSCGPEKGFLCAFAYIIYVNSIRVCIRKHNTRI